jgi:hypothetical protein
MREGYGDKPYDLAMQALKGSKCGSKHRAVTLRGARVIGASTQAHGDVIRAYSDRVSLADERTLLKVDKRPLETLDADTHLHQSR